jgi:hypothetical protein
MYILYEQDQFGKCKFVGRYSTFKLLKAHSAYLNNWFYEYEPVV